MSNLGGEKGVGGKPGAEPDRRENVFWVPQDARSEMLQAAAGQPTIGKLVDDAMNAIERDNPSLRGILPEDYAPLSLDKAVLGGCTRNSWAASLRRGAWSSMGVHQNICYLKPPRDLPIVCLMF